MFSGVPKDIHQPHRPRFLSTERKGGMAMQDAAGHAMTAFNSAPIARVADGSLSAGAWPTPLTVVSFA
jgi:hypothetical protein